MQTPLDPMPMGPRVPLRLRRQLLQMATLPAAGMLATLLAACQTGGQPGPAAARPRWTEAQQRGLRAQGFEPDGDGWALSLAASLLFEFDSDRLRQEQVARLGQIGRELRVLEVPQLRLEGHSDGQGEAAYNLQLSLRRAQAVGLALRSAGWEAQQLRIAGFGHDKPVASNLTEAGRAQNRRVVLIAMAG